MTRRILSAAVALTLAAGSVHAADGFDVVVNTANASRTYTREQLAAVFLKKSARWPNGTAAAPVDQPETSAVRAAFSKDVLGKSVAAVASYWQQQLFSGREVPPPQKAGDAAVIEFVKATAGAVGYVSAGAAPPDVRVTVEK